MCLCAVRAGLTARVVHRLWCETGACLMKGARSGLRRTAERGSPQTRGSALSEVGVVVRVGLVWSDASFPWSEERHLQRIYRDSTTPDIDESTHHFEIHRIDEHSCFVREESQTGVLHQAKKFHAELQLDWGGKALATWKDKPELEREEIVLAVLAKPRGGMDDDARKKESDNRSLAPEITLQEMAGSGGEGFLKLVNALILHDSTTYPIVRHETFERLHGLRLNADVVELPRSQIIRAFQDDRLLARHSYLLDFATNFLYFLVRRVLLYVRLRKAHQIATAEGKLRPDAGGDGLRARGRIRDAVERARILRLLLDGRDRRPQRAILIYLDTCAGFRRRGPLPASYIDRRTDLSPSQHRKIPPSSSITVPAHMRSRSPL